MICVLGPKGGSGKTLTAANLAVALAAERAARGGRRPRPPVRRPRAGDGTRSRSRRSTTWRARAARSTPRRSRPTSRGTCPGVGVLLAPTRPDHASAVSVEFLRELYPVAARDERLRGRRHAARASRRRSSPPSTRHPTSAWSAALDTLALKNTKLGLETLALMGYEHERVKLVLNRADSNVGLSNDAAAAVVGRHPDVLVPSHRDVVRAINSGTPVALHPRARRRHRLPSPRAPLRARRRPRRRRARRRAAASSAARRSGLMQLHERLSGQRAAQPAPAREPDSFAEVKNRDPHGGHRRARARSS